MEKEDLPVAMADREVWLPGPPDDDDEQHERLCHCQCDANNAYAVTELSATV